MQNVLLVKHMKRSFSSLKHELQKFEVVTNKFLQCIKKYKTEKDLCLSSYMNYKKEIKEHINCLFDKNTLVNFENRDYRMIFTYSILLSKRILFQKEHLKNVLISYIANYTKRKKGGDTNPNEEQQVKRKESSIRGGGSDNGNETNELLLLFKFLFFLNVDYDRAIYNHLYSELNNEIEGCPLDELVECIKLISSFKNKKWVNHKVFSRCINEIIKRNNEKQNDYDVLNFLITIVKSCSRLNCEITDISVLLDTFRESYDKNKKSDMHMLIKIIYNLFLCNYHNYKNTNQLIDLLKKEIMQTNKEEDYPLYKKYLYNNNIIIDNNVDLNTDMIKKNTDAYISNDNINNIHQLYFKTREQLKGHLPSTSITSINLYRLKFVDLLIRSDSYLYNTFYSPNSHFFDFVRQLKMEGKEVKETIFSKQAKFFIKENGFKIGYKHVHIYPIIFLPDFKNAYVEFVHNILINKQMKDGTNKIHKLYLNHKIRHMKFLGWDPILLYEHEWKKLRNYNEKLGYIKKAFKSVRSHTQEV
ncbi:conserved Plasmodium protein, unknown function [Plasmodium malariae]|uniref:RAP domain-containing protein n=1 Tax=Plasmodium malariae TaxID=5858 RepID=A0A1C3L116_PLAMA|nr:conserved Plasmodium protein, unknown function [Plasmodium malariae]